MTAYIQEASEERRPYLEQLRALWMEVLAGYQEQMGYGMPGYVKDGQGEVGFANQKHYISVYFTKVDVIQANRHRLASLSVGKSCFRYTNPRKMDLNVIRKPLEDTVKSPQPPC